MTAIRNLGRLSPRFKLIVGLEIIAIFVGAAFVLPGGEDLDHLYHFAQGCLPCAFEPPFGSWLLSFLNLTSDWFRWPLWTLLITVAMLWSSHRFRAEPLLVLLSFPSMAQVWLGQLDGIVAMGLALAMTATNGYVRGFGLLLLALKPQVAGPVILLLLWQEREKAKALAIPVAVMLASFAAWGVAWPIQWLFGHSEDPEINQLPWRLATLFPLGLLAFACVPLLGDKKEQVRAALLATALGVPFYGSYSYVVFLVMGAPWWSLPLSYAWVLAYPWLGKDSLRFAWVLPLALLAHQMWSQRMQGGLRDWRELLSLRPMPDVHTTN